MTPLTPEMLEVVRELRGIVSIAGRIRFCASLLTDESNTTPIETRIIIVRCVLAAMAVELDSAQKRIERSRPQRVTALVDEIRSIAKARIHVRKDSFSQIYSLAREASRLLRSAS